MEMLEIKNTLLDMKNCFNVLIRTLGTAEERNSKLER